MGQKVNPISFRLGYIKTWSSKWFATKSEFPKLLHEDIKIRKYIKKNLGQAAISKVEIERAGEKAKIIIYSARPGVVIGRKGADIDRLRDDIQKISNKEIFIDIKEVKSPTTDAQLIGDNIAFQLEKRIAFRRALKKSVQSAMTGGAKGIKIVISGRLGGAEMARQESIRQGKVPLQTLRADIDYGFSEALTTYGLIGIKVWVYKGDIIVKKQEKEHVEHGINA